MAAARAPPVTLRDFLELGCDSSSDGFRSYPRCLPWSDDALLQAPVRLLVEADLRRNPSRSPSSLARSPSRSPSSLFSLARSPGPGGALARISSLSRSFSRRIKEGFWRRREEDEEEDLFLDDRDSCGFPSPQVSSCSASDSESEADDVAIDDTIPCPSTSEAAAFHCDDKASSSADHDCTDDGAAADGKKKKMQDDGDPARGSKLGMEEDKQQLSPVSVLDFPFDDDDADERSDAGTCSPSFHRRSCPPPAPNLLHARSMTKQQAQVLHKIRRYDGIAQDLDARFTTTTSDSGDSADATTHPATTSSSSTDDTTTSSSATTTTAPCHGEDEHQSVEQQPSLPAAEQEEPGEYRLLARLLQEDTKVADVDEVLLLDFFTEGLDRLRRSSAAGSVARRPVDDDGRDADALVRAASEWLRGAGPQWGIRDVMLSGKAALEDMERGRRWMCVGEEEREVDEAVEGFVMDDLVDELVEELVAPRWHGDGRRSYLDVVRRTLA